MKTYKVYWTEKMSVNIEAESENEAVDKAWDSNYDENQVQTEIDGAMEAVELK